MSMFQVLKFAFECDGYKPDGKPCPCDTAIQAPTAGTAELMAKSLGWRRDHRGWICNAATHRGDR